MRDQSLRCFLCNKFLSGLADCEGVGLREEVGHELIVIVDWIVSDCKWLLGFCEADELYRGCSTLM